MPRKKADVTRHTPEQTAVTSAFQKSAKRHAAEALRVLRDIMHSKTADPSARIQAATKVIEFGHGRPASGEAKNITTVNVQLDGTDQKL